jgi:oligopeptide/dipeptide ABC transporter ATP-binding protein
VIVGCRSAEYSQPVYEALAGALESFTSYELAPLSPRPGRAACTSDTRRLGGEVPSATRLPAGCRFRLRCHRAQSVCAETEPPLAEVAPGHAAVCHFPGPAS